MSNRIAKWVAAAVIYLAVVIGAYYVFEDYLVDEPRHDEHVTEINKNNEAV